MSINISSNDFLISECYPTQFVIIQFIEVKN